jgi:phosphoribosylanthranilate isomerase
MKVKVCGITSYEDAAMALDLGVDALGFNFYRRSSRFIEPVAARRIIERLPPFALSVGLFVNVPQSEEVMESARTAGVHVLQLHGDESPEYCRKLCAWPLIKAVRIGDGPIEENLEAFDVQAFLLDSKDDELFGGTGKHFDWARARDIKKTRPVILAGGLRPENVSEAIRMVNPYAVDVCSGVEYGPGKKDEQRLKEFMNEVRNGCDFR